MSAVFGSLSLFCGGAAAAVFCGMENVPAGLALLGSQFLFLAFQIGSMRR